MEVKTLSTPALGITFNDTFESYFDAYKLGEDIECYQLLYCPYGNGASFDDLDKINFQSRIVILNLMDLMIDGNDNFAIDRLTKFCQDHPEQNFIIFTYHLNLKDEVKIPNLYLDTIMASNLSKKLKPCEKKKISNNWITLSADTKVHKIMTVSYLLSKDYYENGCITFDMDAPAIVSYDKYKNITKIPDRLKDNFSKGFKRFKSKNFNRLDLPKFDRQNSDLADNYNTVLMPVYEKVAVEIVLGTMFFEKSPVLSEKEIQSVYAKNFPIYINGIGMAKEMKKFFGIDIFEDIVTHHYDVIHDPFERLAAAIDKNEHLLNGSTNMQELWLDNQKRFEDNCKKMDDMLFDTSFHRMFNHEKIKQALTYFNVSIE